MTKISREMLMAEIEQGTTVDTSCDATAARSTA